MLIVWAAVLAAAGLLLLPRGRPAARRLARTAGPVRVDRLRPSVSTLLGRRSRLVTAVAGGAVGLLLGGPALAFALLVAVLTALGVAAAMIASRTADRHRDAFGEAVGALAAELRSGRAPPDALKAASASVLGRVGTVLRDVAARAALGGAIPATLHAVAAGTPPVAAGLRGLAARWAVSDASGASLAETVDRLDHDLRAERQAQQRLRSELAGARTTAFLLATLPAVGLVLGAGLGAHPGHVLLHTPAGNVALMLGTALDAAGIGWTARIVRPAIPPSGAGGSW